MFNVFKSPSRFLPLLDHEETEMRPTMAGADKYFPTLARTVGFSLGFEARSLALVLSVFPLATLAAADPHEWRCGR